MSRVPNPKARMSMKPVSISFMSEPNASIVGVTSKEELCLDEASATPELVVLPDRTSTAAGRPNQNRQRAHGTSAGPIPPAAAGGHARGSTKPTGGKSGKEKTEEAP